MYRVFSILFFSSFKVREPDGLLHHTSIAGDNLLGWSTLSVLKWTNIRKMDLIHANFSSNVSSNSNNIILINLAQNF